MRQSAFQLFSFSCGPVLFTFFMDVKMQLDEVNKKKEEERRRKKSQKNK